MIIFVSYFVSNSWYSNNLIDESCIRTVTNHIDVLSTDTQLQNIDPMK